VDRDCLALIRLPREFDRSTAVRRAAHRVSVAWGESMMTFWDGVALVLTFNCVRRNLTEKSGLS